MLQAHIHKTRLALNGLVDTAFWDGSDWGAWVLVHVERGGDLSAEDVLDAIRQNVQSAGSFCFAIEQALSSFKVGGNADASSDDGALVSVVACRFDSFHYEVCLSGAACAFLIDQVGGITDLTPAKAEPIRSSLVTRVLGDIHEAESLVLSAQTLPSDLVAGDGVSFSSAEQLVEHMVRQLRARGLTLGGPVLAVRYQDDIEELQHSDFYHRSPFDRSRYRLNSASRPLFLLLVLIALCAILLIL